ncbi:MAG: hypothetical protein ACLFMT_01550 [Halobacteriales archaeon]
MTETAYVVRLRLGDSGFYRSAVVGVREDSVVVERLRRPTRYRLLPGALGVVGVTYVSFGLWAGVAGSLTGGLLGYGAMKLLSRRWLHRVARRVTSGERALEPDFVLKRGKTEVLEVDVDSGSLTASKADDVLSIKADSDEIEAIANALT